MPVSLQEWHLGLGRILRSASPDQPGLIQENCYIRSPDHTEQKGELTLQIWGEEGYWHIIDRETHELLQAVSQPTTLQALMAAHPAWDARVVAQTLQSVRRGLAQVPPNTEAQIENISLNLTTGCNLHCATCYVPSEDRGPKNLDTEKAIAFLEKLGKHLRPTATISLLGGEPFLHPSGVLAIARWAKQAGHLCNVSTNGTIPLKSLAPEMQKLKLRVQVSIDGATAQTNDAIRGAGTFQKALSTAQDLIASGVHTTLCMVACQQNQHEIGAYLRLAKTLGANEARILPLKRLGNAKSGGLTPTSQLEILEKITAELNRDPSLEMLCQSDLYAILKSMVKESSRRQSCGSGTQTLLIQSDGSVFPCINSTLPKAKLGTTDEDTEAIITHGARWGKTLSVDNAEHPCQKCAVKRWCLACCPGETIQREGNLHSPHWNCIDVKNAITYMMWQSSKTSKGSRAERTRI